MKKEQIEILKKIIKTEEDHYDFNDFVFNYIDEDNLKEIEDENDLNDYLNKINEDLQITNTEIIYYTNAIKYLQENDPSLHESIESAIEYGYTDVEKLNSELLASLLATRNNEKDYCSFINAVIEEAKAQIFDNE